MVLLSTSDVDASSTRNEKSSGAGARSKKSEDFHCHTPAQALKIALDASVARAFAPTTTGGLRLKKAMG